MGRRTVGGGRKPPPFLSPASSFSSSFPKRSRYARRVPSLPKPPLAPPAPPFIGRRKRKPPSRLWMRLDRRGGCEIFINLITREKAMVINLEFIRAVVTADEVLLLEPLAQEVLPFVDKLRRHFPLKSLEVDVDTINVDNQDGKHVEVGPECEVPFEFQVLELALEAVCLSFNSRVADQNRHAIFVLEDLTKNVTTRNLERVRSVKSNLTSLLAAVHEVRDEIEHLLDDNDNMTQLNLSKKLTKSQHNEDSLDPAASNIMFPLERSMVPPKSIIKQRTGVATSVPLDSDAGNLEMLLEAYFIQLDGIRNRIVLVREYIVDTEDYLNIQLDNQRNGLIQFRLTLIIASFGIAINTLIAASFGMNLPHNGDGNTAVGSFWPFVGATSSFCLLLTIMLFGYAWRNRLLGS
ncbi:hypothetical protein QOZ80_3BG0295010 [Eleusine coracana subsp. coracana]|nr:hypothetical protein QOZ80_3BG0295010 [Eleusine coracana subsp. coracana]